MSVITSSSADGSLWQPNKYTKICSEHFIGNAKSEHPLSPNSLYLPANIILNYRIPHTPKLGKFYVRFSQRRRIAEASNVHNGAGDLHAATCWRAITAPAPSSAAAAAAANNTVEIGDEKSPGRLRRSLQRGPGCVGRDVSRNSPVGDGPRVRPGASGGRGGIQENRGKNIGLMP
ncbi:hypothetical protein NQ318_019411, partial [Aromia moschata]